MAESEDWGILLQEREVVLPDPRTRRNLSKRRRQLLQARLSLSCQVMQNLKKTKASQKTWRPLRPQRREPGPERREFSHAKDSREIRRLQRSLVHEQKNENPAMHEEKVWEILQKVVRKHDVCPRKVLSLDEGEDSQNDAETFCRTF